MMADQPRLFPADPAVPEGFQYRPEILTADDERLLVEQIRELPLSNFQFQGYTGKRRVVFFGWSYDFNDRKLRKADEIPDFLLPLREKSAQLAGLEPEQLAHVLLTEYASGAGIGWHRDKAVFGDVVGISLLSS